MGKISKLLSFLFPEGIKCIFCGSDINDQEGYCICEKCKKDLPFQDKNICEICGDVIFAQENICLNCKAKLPAYKKVVSIFWYENEIIKLVYSFKYGGSKYLAKPMANIMSEKLKTENLNFDVILPVPISDKKLKTRGYNQSELLAKEISQKLNCDTYNNILIRVKDTVTQTNLTRKERQENLKDAFAINDKKLIKNKNVLLIDDVLTTGSTAEECSKVLLKNAAKNVYVLSYARTKLKQM